MIAFAPVYLAYRLFYRILGFFHHWYFDASKQFFHWFADYFGALEHALALRVTILHFFQPLWKDYTAVGRVLGVIFRSGRIVVAVTTYLVLGALFYAAYLVWLALPIYLLFVIAGF
ncbi:MAG: hypothetical protein HY435_03450 [Candidatus Liptonbacteria bacterium]|nr:hypothetical protein [Candidatus Liptonbacteria bacterium]